VRRDYRALARAACHTSTELAAAVGPFDDYEKNREPMMHVMEMHWEKVDEIKACPNYLQEAARDLWDKVLAHGKRHGFRNAQATVLAPTGTISFMMDCDTTGIEPDIALVKYKQLAGGGMLKMVNQKVPLALKTLGYDAAQIEAIVTYIDKHDTIEGAPDFKAEHLPVFDCAFPPRNGRRSIAWRAHIRMMAAAQPFIAGAISKTVNMPKESTPDDVGRRLHGGLAAGPEGAGHLPRRLERGAAALDEDQIGQGGGKAGRRPAARAPARHPSLDHPQVQRLRPRGLHHRRPVPRRPAGELFITMAKEGSTIGGLMDCFGTAVSMSLQYGVPLEVYVNKFSHTRFEPMGFTKEPRHQDRQEPGRLHLPLAGDHVPAGLPRGEQDVAAAFAHRSAAPGAGRAGGRASARHYDSQRAGRGPGIGRQRKFVHWSAGGLGQRQRPCQSKTRREAQRLADGCHCWLVQQCGVRRDGPRIGFRRCRGLDLVAIARRAIRLFPDRRPRLRRLRRHHRPLRQLLSLLQLRQ